MFLSSGWVLGCGWSLTFKLIFLINDRDTEYVEFDTVANLKEPLIAKVSH
jgi:hypothetical protein